MVLCAAGEGEVARAAECTHRTRGRGCIGTECLRGLALCRMGPYYF